MRAAFPSLPMALASFRFPSYHPQLPWKAFLDRCDYNMPQVYWEQVHNPATQLTRSVQEFQALTPFRPIVPIGPTYKTGGWAPTENDITEFLNTAKSLNLSGVSFFSWDECRRDLPKLWPVIANYAWTGSGAGSQDLPYQYISALNKGDAIAIANLYSPTAVHINAARTVQGQEAIKTYFTTFLTQLLPKATFTLTGSSGTGTSRNFTWQATSGKGIVHNGSDTLGIQNGKISYHYTYFTITPN
jgi:SnoaL-like domain